MLQAYTSSQSRSSYLNPTYEQSIAQVLGVQDSCQLLTKQVVAAE